MLMELRVNHGRVFVVLTRGRPSTLLVGILRLLRWGLWLENWGDIPLDVLGRLPRGARALTGLIYMGANLRDLSSLTEMTALRVLSIDADPRQPVLLRPMPRLKVLEYGGRNFGNVASVLANPALEFVSIEGAGAGDLQSLGPRVRELTLRYPRSTLDQMLLNGSSLRSLTIGSARDFDLSPVEKYTALKELCLYALRGTTSGFGVLRSLPALRRLELEGVPTVDDPAVIDELKLDYLNVQGRQPFTNEQLRVWDARGVPGNRVRIPAPRRAASRSERVIDGELLAGGTELFLVHPGLPKPIRAEDDLALELGETVPEAWISIPREQQTHQLHVWWARLLAWADEQGADTLVVRSAEADADVILPLSQPKASKLLASPLELAYSRLYRGDHLVVVVNDTVEEGILVVSKRSPLGLVAFDPS
jgi:hypothetical protein